MIAIDEEAVFLEALQKTSAEARADFLSQACGGDDARRKSIELLLKAHERAGHFLHEPVACPADTLDQAATDRVGSQIGRYKLLEQVGEGGMGVVFVAEQTEPVRRRVALKIIKPGMDTKQVIARFEAERQALAMMDHPNIAKIFDAGTTGVGPGRWTGPESPTAMAAQSSAGPAGPTGRPYFVMELVRGTTITEYCDKERLSPRQRLELFVDICHAVQHAHQKGIIHRDLKPSNVMVTLHDGTPVVKVIDFGVAKATTLARSASEGHTVYTALNQIVGTPLYMSPEQAEMSGLDVDTRSDVYSLGVLLYELLTGTTPFEQERLKSVGFDEMRRIIREEEPETVSTRLAKTRRVGQARAASAGPPNHGRANERRWAGAALVPPYAELDWIVAKSLEKDRTRRYESASSLAADIQRYLSDEPVLACPPTTMYRLQKFARKHKPALATAAAISLCLILGTTVSAWQAVRATTAEAQANANANQAQEKAQEATQQRDEVKAVNEKLHATQAELRSTLYAAHINLAQHAWDASNPERMDELLKQHRPKPGQNDVRGFEWHYLFRLCHSELLTLTGHTYTVISVAYSPDGKRLASADRSRWDATKRANSEGQVKVWDAQTGQMLLTLKHDRGVNGIAFGADSNCIASTTSRELKVWDARSGRELLSINGHFDKIAFSPDGKRLATGVYKELEGDKWELEVKFWDAQTGQEQLSCKGRPENPRAFAFSPDGKRLAVAFYNIVRVWDAETGQELLSVPAASGNVAFHPDGNQLATGGGQATRLWDAQTGQLLRTLDGQANDVAYSPDGKVLAGSSWRGTLRLWDLPSGKEIRTLLGRFGTLAFSPDGKQLASPAEDNTIRIWDARNDQESRSLKTGNSVSFSHDWRRVAGIASDNTLTICDVETGQPVVTLKGHTSQVQLVAFSPDGLRFASGARGRVGGGSGVGPNSRAEVKVWDALTGNEQLTIPGLIGTIFGLAFSPDSKRLLTASQSPPDASTVGLRVWDAQTGAELVAIKGHTGPIWGVTFSPDGEHVVSAGGEVKIWDSKSGEELHRFERLPDGWFESVGYSADGRHLASGRSDGIVKIWDVQTRRELISFRAHTARITSVSFSADGKRLATQANEGKAKLWDAQPGHEYLTFEGAAGRFNRAIFSPNGNHLAVNGPNGTVKIYDATPVAEKP